MFAMPNHDNSFLAPIGMPLKGETSFEKFSNGKELEAYIHESFADLSYLMPNIASARDSAKLGNFVYLKCDPWFYNKFLLVGDSCHAMSPLFVSGLNTGLESITKLSEFIDQE
jgi:kynurenine 3-monooxygenase